MDPDACLQRFLEACQDKDKEEAIASLEDLLEWLKRGGYLPSPSKKEGETWEITCLRLYSEMEKS